MTEEEYKIIGVRFTEKEIEELRRLVGCPQAATAVGIIVRKWLKEQQND